MTNETIYKTSISNKLNPFISSLSTLIEEYKVIIVGISESLPKIESQIDDNVLEARELLNFIFSTGEKQESYGVKHEMDQFHHELNTALKTLKSSEDDDRAIFKKLKESISLSTKTLNKTEAIRNISENLKVFAINSIVYSQKSGNRGKGYQIISGEFIRLSEAIAAGTEQINLIAEEMHQQISDFHELIEQQEEFSRDHIEAISENSTNLLSKANKSVENFAIIINDLLDRIEKVKEPTARIMTELQKQDIIQQQLEHLMDSIKDILLIIENPVEYAEENTDQNIFTLLGILMVTVETQIKRISEDLYEMLDGMEVLFDDMNSSITDIDLDKNHFSQLVKPESDSCEILKSGQSVVDIIFSAPGEMIKTIKTDLNSSITGKDRITDYFSGIEEKIREEKKIALTFFPVIEAINNLLVLAKIEQARYELNISGQGKTGEGFFSSNVYSELSAIIEEIDLAHSTVADNLSDSIKSFASQKENFDGIEYRLNASGAIVEKTREMFIDNFELVINITNELFCHVTRHIQLFKSLRKLVADITDKIKICTDIKKIVDEELNKLGGPVDLEECIFRDVIIQNIVDKCTVEKERTTLAENFQEFRIEETTGTSITLF